METLHAAARARYSTGLVTVAPSALFLWVVFRAALETALLHHLSGRPRNAAIVASLAGLLVLGARAGSFLAMRLNRALARSAPPAQPAPEIRQEPFCVLRERSGRQQTHLQR